MATRINGRKWRRDRDGAIFWVSDDSNYTDASLDSLEEDAITASEMEYGRPGKKEILTEAYRRIGAVLNVNNRDAVKTREHSLRARAESLLIRNALGFTLTASQRDFLTQYVTSIMEVQAIKEAAELLLTSRPVDYINDRHWP